MRCVRHATHCCSPTPISQRPPRCCRYDGSLATSTSATAWRRRHGSTGRRAPRGGCRNSPTQSKHGTPPLSMLPMRLSQTSKKLAAGSATCMQSNGHSLHSVPTAAKRLTNSPCLPATKSAASNWCSTTTRCLPLVSNCIAPFVDQATDCCCRTRTKLPPVSTTTTPTC